LLAVALAAIGLFISAVSGSNTANLSVSFSCCWRYSRRRKCRAA
jgi:hypothetical protein